MTDLPGALSTRKVLTETTTYVASAPGRYRYVTPTDVATGAEAVGPARGVQIIRTTEPDGEHVVVEARLLVGTTMAPAQIPVAVLLDGPSEVFTFLEQYAPEVLDLAVQWTATDDEQEPR